MMSETLGKWHFWLFFIGFHMTFDTMHFVGILGMPRSIYTYEADRGWGTLNLIISVGAMIQGIAILIFVWNLIHSYFHGEEGRKRSVGCVDAGVGHAFAAAGLQLCDEPVVRSRRPLWDIKHPNDPDWKYER